MSTTNSSFRSMDSQTKLIAFTSIILTTLLMVLILVCMPQIYEVIHDHQRQKNLESSFENEIAMKCSGTKKCTAVLNDDTTLPLKMVGDVDQTWIILGDRKMETDYFLKNIYNRPFPGAVLKVNTTLE